jgi:hypothetical protein
VLVARRVIAGLTRSLRPPLLSNFTCDLERAFVGLRTRICEEDLGSIERRRVVAFGEFYQEFCKLARILVVVEVACVEQFSSLILQDLQPREPSAGDVSDSNTHFEYTLVSMSQRIDGDSGAEVQVLPPSSIPEPRSFPVGQNERCSRVNWKYIFVSPVDCILVLFGMRKVGVHGLQVFRAWSL